VGALPRMQVFPAGSPLRVKVQTPPEPELLRAPALVDVSCPGGWDALAALAWTDRPVVAVVGDDPVEVRRAHTCGAWEVVHAGRLEAELPLRLEAVMARARQGLHLTLLQQLAAGYAAADAPEALLHEVTRWLAETMGIQRAALVALDEAQGVGFLVASSDDRTRQGLRIELDRYPEIREVIRTQRPVLLEEAQGHPLLEQAREQLTAQGVQAIAALPLLQQGRVVGVMLLRAGGGRQSFSPEELQVLAAVAHATALALRHVRLLESVRGQTERERRAKAAVEQIRQAKEFLERLIDSSVDAILAADLRGRIILFNKGAEDICGYTAEEARGLNVQQLYPPGHAKELMAALRAGQGRLGPRRQDILTRTGERVPVNMTASIVYENGREVATLGIFSDLRTLMRLEQKLTETEGKLQQSEKQAVLVALAGTTAHELNQPLTCVLGYAELLKRRAVPSSPDYKALDAIHREAERMADIVRKIGKITRYETMAYVGDQVIVDLDKASSHED
jgi:PAS domain S-box-containing protein